MSPAHLVSVQDRLRRIRAIFLSIIFLSINPMSYEVELKFPVPDLQPFPKKLTDLAVPISPAQEEIDLYFAHPAAGFRANGRGPPAPPQGRCELHHLQRPQDRRHDQDPPRDRTAAGPRPGIVGLLDRAAGRRSVSGRWAKSASPAARPRSLGKAARSKPAWTKSTASARSSSSNWLPRKARSKRPGPASNRWPNRSA